MDKYSDQIEITWGPQSANGRLEIVTSGSCTFSNAGSAIKSSCNYVLGVAAPLANPRFERDIVTNPTIINQPSVITATGNPSSGASAFCNDWSDIEIKTNPSGYYFNNIEWSISPSGSPLYVEKIDDYGNGRIKLGAGTLTTGGYTITAKLEAGIGNYRESYPFILDVKSPKPGPPVVTVPILCSADNILVHAGTTTGPLTDWQNVEFEIESGPGAIFSDNGTKSIIRSTGNANVYTQGMVAGESFKVRCRNIYSCGTSDWSNYTTFTLTDYNPISLTKTDGATYSCKTGSFTISLGLPTGVTLPSGATITYEVVNSPAKILNQATNTYITKLENTTNLSVVIDPSSIPATNFDPIIVNAKIVYPCHASQIVACTLQTAIPQFTTGVVSATINSINTFFCYNYFLNLALDGINLNAIEDVDWIVFREYSHKVGNTTLAITVPLSTGNESGNKNSEFSFDVTPYMFKLIKFTAYAYPKRCGQTSVAQGSIPMLEIYPSVANGSCTASGLFPFYCLPSCESVIPDPESVISLTSFQQTEDKFYISLFPNPTPGEIMLQGFSVEEKSRGSIFNLQGKLVEEIEFVDNKSFTKLSAGIYFLELPNHPRLKLVVQ